MKYRCVQCGFGMKSLFVQYSPGNIRLMKCENCKAVADEYIECEIMILVIDLILQNPKAYRHLLFNVLDSQNPNLQGLLWKCSLGFLLLDAYRSIFICQTKEECGFPTSTDFLVRTFRKMLIDVVLGNVLFCCTFLISTRFLINTSSARIRYIDIFLSILISSYFKLFILAMMVWEFPSYVVFIVDLYVLSSNIVALEVITESTRSNCVMACLSAHLMKFLVTQIPEFRTLYSHIGSVP